MSRKPPPGNQGKRPWLFIHNRRRINPVTLQLRRGSEEETQSSPAEQNSPEANPTVHPGAGAPPTQAQQSRDRVAELTADLQRIQAEYDNYRKRIQRDRLAVREIAVANVLTGLLPVLDAIEQAREHGEVSGGQTAIVDMLESHLAALGLQPVGKPGEPFNPLVHEALTYIQVKNASEPICTAVLRRGYRVGDQLLRPAQVSVSGPPAAPAPGHGQTSTNPPTSPALSSGATDRRKT